MAHNIFEQRMFAVGKAWHDVGVRVEKEIQSAEAIKLANLDYRIEKVRLFGKKDDNIIESDIYGTLNTANNKILGTVSDHYKIVQNVEAFEFFDNIVKSGEAFYHSAGALGNGERVWLLAKLPQNILLFKDIDIIEKYLLLVNNHDGKGSLQMYFTPIRVVCQNTLIASFRDKENYISIRHMGNMKNKIDEARIALGFALDFYTDFEENAKKMLNTSWTLENAENFFEKLLDIKKEDKEEISTQKINSLERMKSLFANGRGNDVDGVRNTVWAGYNAVTEYVDHYRTIRGEKANSILFGSGARLKENAYKEAMLLSNT